jgi:hypothetical protein
MSVRPPTLPRLQQISFDAVSERFRSNSHHDPSDDLHSGWAPENIPKMRHIESAGSKPFYKVLHYRDVRYFHYVYSAGAQLSDDVDIAIVRDGCQARLR